MSVVAWDGKTIACDTYCEDSGVQRVWPKLERLPDGTVLGGVGEKGEVAMLVRWFTRNRAVAGDDEPWPAFQGKDSGGSILIVASKLRIDGTPFWICEEYRAQPIAIQVREPFYAWGSGQDFALGAMARGASAHEAVEVACQLSATCAQPICSFELGAK